MGLLASGQDTLPWILPTVGVGVGVSVIVGVGVSVGVGVRVGVGVSVGVEVSVAVGVRVGPNNCPGPQAGINKLMKRISNMMMHGFEFIFSPCTQLLMSAMRQNGATMSSSAQCGHFFNLVVTVSIDDFSFDERGQMCGSPRSRQVWHLHILSL